MTAFRLILGTGFTGGGGGGGDPAFDFSLPNKDIASTAVEGDDVDDFVPVNGVAPYNYTINVIQSFLAPETIVFSDTEIADGSVEDDKVCDLDATLHGQSVTWSITSDPDNKFKIGNPTSSTAELLLADTVDEGTSASHPVTVQCATDRPTPQIVSKAETITVLPASSFLGVTWDPSNKSSLITLSNGDLTATPTSSSAHQPVRTTHAIASTEKKYWEVFIPGNDPNERIHGIVDSNFDATGTVHVGGATNSYGQRPPGQFVTGYTIANSPGTYTAPEHYLMFARDGDSLWVGRNGTWFSSGNPATGANPTVTGLGTANDIYPACSVRTSLGVTLRVSDSDFVGTVPSGFVSMDTDLT